MSDPKDSSYRLVYSTEGGPICKGCQNPQPRCVCAEKRQQVVKGDGKVRVRRETKGRGGKTVTTISGLALTRAELAKLLQELKRVCGAGGTEKDGVIEVQGDHTELVVTHLTKKGIAAKRAGG